MQAKQHAVWDISVVDMPAMYTSTYESNKCDGLFARVVYHK